jgi:hypothetical protein
MIAPNGSVGVLAIDASMSVIWHLYITLSDMLVPDEVNWDHPQ